MPHPELHVIGIDPGGTTGWIRITVPRKSIYGDAPSEILEWDAGEVTGSEPEQVEKIARYVREKHGLSYKVGPAVVVEKFDNQNPFEDDEVFSPVRIGAMLTYAQFLGKLGDAKVTFQGRGIAFQHMTDERLKRRGFWMRGEEHARDAARHAITALRRAKQSPAFRDQLWNKALPDLLLHTLTLKSRKLNQTDWSRITPGLQGRLTATGNDDNGQFAWIDIRPER